MKYLIVLLITLASCVGSKFTTYTIPKGEQYSKPYKLDPTTSDVIEFIVIFNKTAKYETKDKSNQADINKLAGFSDCGQHHHSNSARFGWRYIDELQLLPYVYNDGVRLWNTKEGLAPLVLYRPKFGEEVLCKIVKFSNAYNFYINNEFKVSIPNGCDNLHAIKYILLAYFGGDEKAPHDIQIEIKFLQK